MAPKSARPLGLAEVTLTLVDPELSEAVAKVIDGQMDAAAEASSEAASAEAEAHDVLLADAADTPAEESAPEIGASIKARKKRAVEKHAISMRPGEIVVGRRLYRSGQSEYIINGRVARLRDVQEIFMGVGLGPDSYAIIEQGRIGQILNSKPMDRRAIIEEAAGITMYKTKRRLAEAKLEASKINLSRVNDILVEVEKQLASLKRQASKARRYAELREQMRGLLRIVLASKAEHLDIEAARLENLLRDMDAAEERESKSVHELEGEQERLSGRTYELDAELRQTQNLLGQTALDLDRAENRITFNREQAAQLASRAERLAMEIELAARQIVDLAARVDVQKESVAALRTQAAALETGLREASENVSTRAAEQSRLETRMEELRRLAGRLVEESARQQAESLQAEEAAARHTAAEETRASTLLAIEQECLALEARLAGAENAFALASRQAQQSGAAVRESQANLASLRHAQQETSQQLERTRQELSAARARHASLEQILRERAYTADAVQKLFNASSSGSAPSDSSRAGFRAVGLLADYTEVQEEYEAAIEQFLREELEYVVVESFDQARAGVALLRDEVGGRATFFVDSIEQPRNRPLRARRRLLDARQFHRALGQAGRVPRAARRRHKILPQEASRRLSRRISRRRRAHGPRASAQLFLDARGHLLSRSHGFRRAQGRSGPARAQARTPPARDGSGPPRTVRRRAAARADPSRRADRSRRSADRLRERAADGSGKIARRSHAPARSGAQRIAARQPAIRRRTRRDRPAPRRRRSRPCASRKRPHAARRRASFRARQRKQKAPRPPKPSPICAVISQGLQEQVVARREELAAMAERLSSAEAVEARLADEKAQAGERVNSLRQQHAALLEERAAIESSCEQIALQAEELRKEKLRLEEQKAAFEGEWEQARTRTAQIEDSLRGQRQSLDELRAERSQRQIEKARNDADRDYLRQTCVSELNAQPEELMAQQEQASCSPAKI